MTLQRGILIKEPNIVQPRDSGNAVSTASGFVWKKQTRFGNTWRKLNEPKDSCKEKKKIAVIIQWNLLAQVDRYIGNRYGGRMYTLLTKIQSLSVVPAQNTDIAASTNCIE